MSKGKNRSRKKGMMTKTITPKKKFNLNSMDSVKEDQVHPVLVPLVRKMQVDIEKRVRYAEMKGLQQHQKVMSMLDEIKTNQIVVQTLLLNRGIIDRQEFTNEFHRYMNEVIGVVRDGQMEGNVFIDMYNIGVSPRENSLKEIKDQSKNPVIINRS